MARRGIITLACGLVVAKAAIFGKMIYLGMSVDATISQIPPAPAIALRRDFEDRNGKLLAVHIQPRITIPARGMSFRQYEV